MKALVIAGCLVLAVYAGFLMGNRAVDGAPDLPQVASDPALPSSSSPLVAPPSREAEVASAALSWADRFAEVPPGQFDPLSIAVPDGIVWYGTWEDAIAEVERTGKPMMLHFGSPRCPKQEVCVPGTW